MSVSFVAQAAMPNATAKASSRSAPQGGAKDPFAALLEPGKSNARAAARQEHGTDKAELSNRTRLGDGSEFLQDEPQIGTIAAEEDKAEASTETTDADEQSQDPTLILTAILQLGTARGDPVRLDAPNRGNETAATASNSVAEGENQKKSAPAEPKATTAGTQASPVATASLLASSPSTPLATAAIDDASQGGAVAQREPQPERTRDTRATAIASAMSGEDRQARTAAIEPTLAAAAAAGSGSESPGEERANDGARARSNVTADERHVTPADDRGVASSEPLLPGKVNIVTSQTTAAPAVAQMSPTSSAMVSSLGADGEFVAASREAAALPPRTDAAPATLHTLKIQLNPAELGQVTARLTMSGDEISVELQVETAEAHRKLGADSDEIVKSLRALGFEIERVTIQQAPSASASTGGQADRGNTTSQMDGGSREAEHNGERNGGQKNRGDDNSGERGTAGRASAGSDHGAGVYI